MIWLEICRLDPHTAAISLENKMNSLIFSWRYAFSLIKVIIETFSWALMKSIHKRWKRAIYYFHQAVGTRIFDWCPIKSIYTRFWKANVFIWWFPMHWPHRSNKWILLRNAKFSSCKSYKLILIVYSLRSQRSKVCGLIHSFQEKF